MSYADRAVADDHNARTVPPGDAQGEATMFGRAHLALQTILPMLSEAQAEAILAAIADPAVLPKWMEEVAEKKRASKAEGGPLAVVRGRQNTHG